MQSYRVYLARRDAFADALHHAAALVAQDGREDALRVCTSAKRRNNNTANNKNKITTKIAIRKYN
jgi:hypothetical protein